MRDEKKVVLVADDEPDAIDFVRSVLEGEFHVVAAPNGQAALGAARAPSPY